MLQTVERFVYFGKLFGQKVEKACVSLDAAMLEALNYSQINQDNIHKNEILDKFSGKVYQSSDIIDFWLDEGLVNEERFEW